MRIPALEMERTSGETRNRLLGIQAKMGRVTNMKSTAAHSLVALDALLHWYPLRDEVQAFLGERRTILFCHAISSTSDCLICSTYFRRILMDWGENPEQLILDEQEQFIVALGRQMVTDANHVSDKLFSDLKSFLNDKQLVTLTAFGAIMIATNVFNNALRIDLDPYLQPYKQI